MAKYRVIGPQPVDDVAPGGTVELAEHDAARLTAGGHVEPLATRKQNDLATNNSTEEQE